MASASNEESAQTALALARLAQTNPGHAKKTLALRSADMQDANPAAAQEQLYSKPPPCRIPLAREPSASGPRRLPARQRTRRPGSLRYNCVLCGPRLRRCHADCFPPSPAARNRPLRGQSARQLAGILHASRPLPPLNEIWRGRNPQPPPTPDARPLHPQWAALKKAAPPMA
jgi:hypothetical protein